jgi:hypothetical protein
MAKAMQTQSGSEPMTLSNMRRLGVYALAVVMTGFRPLVEQPTGLF